MISKSPTTSRTERIAQLNDRCRHGLDRNARIVVTSNCLARLAPSGTKIAEVLAQVELMRAIRQASFDRDSPERDKGAVTVGDTEVLFKIDLYDPGLVKVALNGSFC